MGNTNRYVTGMILAAAMIAFAGFFFLRGAVRTVRHADFDMSYNMPRPKSALYNFFFGLEGREIERTEINPFKDKKDAKKLPDAKNAAKIDPKAQAAEAAKKAAQQKAAATAAAAQKKPEMKVTINNAAPTAPLVSSDLNPETQTQSGGAIGAMPTAQANANNQAKADTLSAAQWRALVVGQPTKENVSKLINAFNNKEVDANTLYLIMNDLIQSSNTETQAMALVIAQAVPSLKSFSTVSTNYDKLDATNKKTADTYMMSYMSGSKLSILALALQSDDTQVVTHAAQVMVAGLEQAKNGQNAGGTRANSGGRGVVASGTKNTYSQFVSIFENLTKSGDSTVAGLAQNALTQIQSLSNT